MRRTGAATILVLALAAAVIAPSHAAPASPKAAKATLDLCKVVSRSAVENRIGTPLGTPHDLSTEAIAAACHFPAGAVGGTDVGLFASRDVPSGIRHSYGGNFFATLDSFQRVYGTPQTVAGVGTSAYVAFTPGPLAQGALLVLDGTKQAVLVVLVGQYVTQANTITRGRMLARMVIKTARFS